MYRKVRAFEQEHHVSIVTPASALKGLTKANAGLQRGKVYQGEGNDLHYVVQEGDDMTSVSISWGVSAAAIRELNNLGEGDQLQPGQVIKLPVDTQL